MAKLIKTTSGLTTADGGNLPVGAVIKFEVEFPIYMKGYKMKLYFYRSQELYESGYHPIKMKDFNHEYDIILSDEQLESLTFAQMTQNAVGHVNAGFGTVVCEIVEE